MKARCPRCEEPFDDHDECATCGRRHCAAEICEKRLKVIGKAFPRCKHRERPLAVQDAKGRWRPLKPTFGKSVICPTCKKIQEA